MPSTYSSNLKLELMATGENSGTWGNITNTNLGTAVEQAIIGYGSVVYASDANLTISITNSNAAQAARALVLNVTSSLSLTATRELVVPTIEKQYIVQNNTTGAQSITVKTSAGTGITVPNGRKAHLYVDGTNVIQMFDFVDINGGTIDGAAIGGSSAAAGAFTTLSASGASTFNGAVTLGDAAADNITFNGTITSHLLFTDNTYDIGASGATRPRNLFLAGNATVGGNLSVGGTLTLTGGLILNGNVTVGDSSADTLTVNATITSNLLFTDNTYDIGASGATRPRNLFLAGNATIGGNTTMTGTLTVDSTTDSTSIITGSIQTDGGVGVAKALYVGTTLNVAGAATLSGAVTLGDAAADNVTVNGTVTSNLIFTDNTYDIGASGATRPRNLFLANNATIGGLTASKVVFTDANKVLSSTGTVATDQGGTGQTSYTAGDLLYYAAGTSLTKLGIGAANTVLTSSGTAPQWSSSLTLGGTLTVTGNATFNANVTLGDATSDTITATGRLASDLIPSTDNARDLGSSSLQFRSVYAETSFVENGYNVVTQADIGSGANEIPLNQYLGSMAYQNGDSYYNIGMTMGYRNRIINGAMQIDQRNAGASVTASDTTNAVYTVDRWAYRVLAASKVSFQQSSTAPSNFKNSLLATSLSAYTVGASEFFNIRQPIEGLNAVDLGWGTSSAQSVTISFWVRSSLTGLFGGYIANSADNRLYIFSYTINTANTWEYKTITVPGETTGTWLTTNGVGIQLGFSLGAGANYQGTPGSWGTSVLIAPTGQTNVMGTNGATWYVTGVQIEVGDQATPFDWRPYTTELELCQRYYQKSFSTASAPANSVATGTVVRNLVPYSTTQSYMDSVEFATEMRAAPTVTIYNTSAIATANAIAYYDGAWQAATSSTATKIRTGGFAPEATGSFTAYVPRLGEFAWAASSEL